MKRTPLIQSLISQVQTWFSQAKQQATEPEEVLKAPPDDRLADLRSAAAQLPQPPKYKEFIRTELLAAVTRWREQVDAENNLVFLEAPSEPLGTFLTAALAYWPEIEVELVQPLKHHARPADPLAVQAQLRNALANRQQEAAEHGRSPDAQEQASPDAAESDDPLANRRQIILVPALEECFLRCIQGWEGIEYLQNLVVQDTSRFWVVGCSTWGWAFLDRVCHVSAYLEQTVPLPVLDGEDLKDWLHPLTLQVDENLPDEEEESCAEKTPWSTLSNTAKGKGAIAAQLWIRALGVRKEDLAKIDQPETDPPRPLPLYPRKPILPNLPSLTPMDRYLLHSLLIHRTLTRPQLALSLGESENIVRSRVQVLSRDGVILQSQGLLTVNPIHYPLLRRELGNNNFLIGES